ncbi:hypothetical protein TNCT_214061 [Trichonephila clavata]|uniref:Uncharacterized protein n=1 Tax=Trichonephila clavata TaxID=2740835 RepID=A0A8X6HY57_TRICU|nr:hypothetical protein TNCT_214061 [Trichonephila clavata]
MTLFAHFGLTLLYDSVMDNKNKFNLSVLDISSSAWKNVLLTTSKQGSEIASDHAFERANIAYNTYFYRAMYRSLLLFGTTFRMPYHSQEVGGVGATRSKDDAYKEAT